MTQANSVKWKAKTKLYKFKASPLIYPHCDFIAGFAGSANDMITAVDFFNHPENFKRAPMLKEFQGLILTEQQDIYLFNSVVNWIKISDPFAAIGSGTPFALGAMESGATPKEAVRAAMKRDPWSGLGVKTMHW